tara:strand:+ start:2861 stop:4558 length:1698 start_codon:yes stop_codon:yes gene_type:complete
MSKKKNLLISSTIKAKSWLNNIDDNYSKIKIKELLDDNDKTNLIEAFHKNLEFGTGGLRGEIGIGSNKINNYTIGLATQGLSNYLKKKFNGSIKVSIGYDTRLFSKEFAYEAAIIFSSNNIKSYLFSDIRPTPLVSYAVRKLNCQCGIMITASHNPKEYNGYKVYWSDGGQIVYPHDINIINEVNKLDDISNIKRKNKSLIKLIDESIDKPYLDDLSKLSLFSNENSKLKILYTPIHGTGIKIVPQAIKSFGFKNVKIIKSQEKPDPNFSTVKSPNPEEYYALEEGIKELKKTKSNILLATDPDTDRVGVVELDNKGREIILNGNQLASLIVHYVITQKSKEKSLQKNSYVAKTIVTTPLIDRICKKYSVSCYSTLTGFKNIAKLIEDKKNEKFIAGGEESYGYLIGDFVRDKDAVISSSIICEISNFAQTKGMNLSSYLEKIHDTFGYFKEELFSITYKGVEGKKKINNIMKDYILKPPKTIFSKKIKTFINYNESSNSNIIMSKSNVLQFITNENYILTLRPSGTEPKIKFYFSVNCKNKSNNIKKINYLLDNEIDKIKKKYE